MQKNNFKKRESIVIALYCVSVIISVYILVTIYNSYTYISELVYKNNLVVKDQLLNVISYYVNASMPYIFYALVIWGIAYIINKLNYLNNRDIDDDIKISNKSLENEEKELDLFVNELNQNRDKNL